MLKVHELQQIATYFEQAMVQNYESQSFAEAFHILDKRLDIPYCIVLFFVNHEIVHLEVYPSCKEAMEQIGCNFEQLSTQKFTRVVAFDSEKNMRYCYHTFSTSKKPSV